MSNPRKSSGILGLSQYSDSEGSGQDSESESEPHENKGTMEVIETEAKQCSNMQDELLRVPAITSLSTGQHSQSNSPSSLFGTSVGFRASPNQQQAVQSVVEDFPLDEEDRPTSPVSFHKTLEGLNENEIVVPPEPPTRCAGSVIEKMKQLKEKKDRGMDMVSLIQKRKDFRNPSIYEKLIVHCGIDEFGTNFASEFYDPHKWSSESYYESLSSAQKDLMDQRERERKEKSTKVEIVVGTAKKSSSGPETHRHSHHHHQSSSQDRGREKRSKWDVPAAGSKMSTVPPVVQLTSTKSNVILGHSSSKKKK